MDREQYRDAFGFTGPLPLSSNQRRIPEPGFDSGLAVGAPLPDFSLCDHTGRRLSLHADRGDAPAAVVFFRSVVWSPACLTQLGELQDALPAFRAAGVGVYGVSYDDREALAEYARARHIGFPLLSDPSSAVIWRLRLLNTLLAPSDVPFYGVPYPGTCLLDRSGVIAAKFFHRHMSKRVSAETVLDAATGEIPLGEEPAATVGGDGVRITLFLRGGGGTLRMGAVRRLVARFALDEGVALCAPPGGAGVTGAALEVADLEGLCVGAPQGPVPEGIAVDGRGDPVPAFTGCVDLVMPVWANSDLVCIMAPPRRERVKLEVTLRYQQITDGTLRSPRSERVVLELPVLPHDVPNLPEIGGTGHRVVPMESLLHFQRLIRRAAREDEEA